MVVNQSGPVSYRIRTDSGMVVRRHVDHVTKRLDPATQTNPDSTHTDADTDTSFDDYPAPSSNTGKAALIAPDPPPRDHLTGILSGNEGRRLMSLIMEV